MLCKLGELIVIFALAIVLFMIVCLAKVCTSWARRDESHLQDRRIEDVWEDFGETSSDEEDEKDS